MQKHQDREGEGIVVKVFVERDYGFARSGSTVIYFRLSELIGQAVPGMRVGLTWYTPADGGRARASSIWPLGGEAERVECTVTRWVESKAYGFARAPDMPRVFIPPPVFPEGVEKPQAGDRLLGVVDATDPRGPTMLTAEIVERAGASLVLGITVEDFLRRGGEEEDEEAEED